MDHARTQHSLEANAIVAGIGIEPNVELAAHAGLSVANGIVVDVFGRVDSREDVFAAGDVARFPVPALAAEMRVEHEDHAKSHGRRVGANMAGAREPYDHLSFFYSDLFDLGYEAVGELDSRLDTFAELGDLHDPGVVYYLDSAAQTARRAALESVRPRRRRARVDPRGRASDARRAQGAGGLT